MDNTGIYIHIPFCEKKCPYCDFYSHKANETEIDDYVSALSEKIYAFSEKYKYTADSLYFGGGTPGLIGAKRLAGLVSDVKNSFGIYKNSEITVEVNPTNEDIDFEMLKCAGINRISIGLQSANDNELKELGRLHNTQQAKKCIKKVKASGIDNISLDLMLGIPYQTKESLKRSIDFCIEQGAKHISAYLLKIEEGTIFHKKRESLVLPTDDESADLYEELCRLMNEYGYEHYEISNFCKRGFEGKHNLKYWHDEEYIGIGASAHSFIEGRRFYFPKNMKKFFSGEITYDSTGGDEQEFIMLGLRLSEGITKERFYSRFGKEIPDEYIKRAEKFVKSGYVRTSQNGFALTEKGFLISNYLISEIIG